MNNIGDIGLWEKIIDKVPPHYVIIGVALFYGLKFLKGLGSLGHIVYRNWNEQYLQYVSKNIKLNKIYVELIQENHRILQEVANELKRFREFNDEKSKKKRTIKK